MPLDKASLERLIEASPDIVIATDTDGSVAYYNDGALGILGYSRDEIIGEPVTKVYPSLDEAKRVKAAMRDPNVSRKGSIENFETVFVAKNGREIPCAISGVILYDANGKEEGTIGFSKDLREIQHKDQLAVLGEIAIGLSHEINNPLETISNQVALLQRFVEKLPVTPQRDAERARLDDMHGEIRRIETHLRRLSEMSEREEYASTDYIGGARMVDLSDLGSEPSDPLAGQRVLVVDDDRGVRESVAELLRCEGSVVETAEDGLRALERLEISPFDVVLSDVVMPQMDGYELFTECQRRSPETVVVLMTAFYYDKDHVIKRSRLEGLEGVVFKKPVDPDRLRTVLSELIRSNRRPDASRR
jgi:PAS domain S-box-containing protein